MGGVGTTFSNRPMVDGDTVKVIKLNDSIAYIYAGRSTGSLVAVEIRHALIVLRNVHITVLISVQENVCNNSKK